MKAMDVKWIKKMLTNFALFCHLCESSVLWKKVPKLNEIVTTHKLPNSHLFSPYLSTHMTNFLQARC